MLNVPYTRYCLIKIIMHIGYCHHLVTVIYVRLAKSDYIKMFLLGKAIGMLKVISSVVGKVRFGKKDRESDFVYVSVRSRMCLFVSICMKEI